MRRRKKEVEKERKKKKAKRRRRNDQESVREKGERMIQYCLFLIDGDYPFHGLSGIISHN